MRSSYLDYAMSVIVGRALPDVRDGLKPVHRRVLYSMYEAGLQPNRPHRKCANVVGGVMGNYHPHGDSAIYDTLVRLGQDFAMRYPLIDPQGNFGSIDNDSAGGDAVHRGAPRRGWPRRCSATSTRTPSTSARTTTSRARSRSSCRRASRTCSSTARPGSPSGWPRTSRRTTCARRSTRCVAYIDDPDDRRRRPDEAHQGPGLPDRRHHRRARRHPGRLRDRPRPRGRARHARTSSRWSAARSASSSPRCPTRSTRATAAATAAA